MATDSFKQVYFNDGEGLVHTDLTDLQKMLESKIWDQIVHNQIGALGLHPADFPVGTNGVDHVMSGQDGANHPSSRCYCLNPGAAYLRKGTANSKIQIAPGTLLQKIGAYTGDDPTLIAYTFVGTEEFTLTNGDATNPRVDLLQMKLEYVIGDLQSRDFEDAATRIITTTSYNKKRRVQCTLSVKAGTPAASPTIPQPDSGYVAVGMALVGNGWTTAGAAPIFGLDTAAANNVVVYDQRMPIKIKAYSVPASQMIRTSNFTLSADGDTVTRSNASNTLLVTCPHTPNGRLIGVQVTALTSASGITGQSLAHRELRGGAPTVNSRNSLADLTGLASVSSECVSFWVFEASHAPSAGPTIVASGTVTNRLGVPLWTNGRRCPYEEQKLVTGGSRGSDRLIYRLTNTSDCSLYEVIFYVAEGL